MSDFGTAAHAAAFDSRFAAHRSEVHDRASNASAAVAAGISSLISDTPPQATVAARPAADVPPAPYVERALIPDAPLMQRTADEDGIPL